MARKRASLDSNAMPWTEFIAGYRIAMGALMGPGSQSPVALEAGSPAAQRLADLENHGEPSEVLSGDENVPVESVPVENMTPEMRTKLEADPYSRVLLALREHFGQGYPYYRPLLYRFWGLYDLVHRGRLANWVQSREDGTLGLHPALLLAASEVKLTKKGKFPVDRFCAQVTQIIATEMENPNGQRIRGVAPEPAAPIDANN
ncbi:MAG: hypothetical protein ACI8PT_001248 [Gammaproteobacteria bacterium]|jgi:hypothetical protein